jgi:hypothetical protein
LPLTLLKSLRNEIILYQLDNEIIATIELRDDEVHPIDARSSPRLHKYVTSHNKFAENLMWLQSFFFPMTCIISVFNMVKGKPLF